MKREDFLELMNEVDDDLLERSERAAKPRKPLWRRLSAIAAAFALVAVVGVIALKVARVNEGAGAGSGGNRGLDYMAYVGPVLPLTTLTDSDGLTASRLIDYDFSTYLNATSKANVTDRYVLTNTTDRDMTVTLAYPFAEHLNAEADRMPQITVDGTTAEIALYAGPYTGAYTGVWGSDKAENSSVNIDSLSSFEEYRDLLSDGSYLASAFDELPELTQRVTVYKITDPVVSASAAESSQNPTLAMEFYIDYAKTSVMTYGTNGARWNEKTGFVSRSFSIPHENWPDYGDPRYIVILGEDIDGYTLQGYRDGGCDKGEEVDITATVTRYETTLGDVLRECVADYRSEWSRDSSISGAAVSDEMFFGLAAELLLTDGPLSANGVERYQNGWLDDILSAVQTNGRVMYLTFEVTVPAHGSVTVDCTMVRDAHVNYVGEGHNLQGYDMATTLGSTLTFTSQTASVTNTDAIEIVEQNFGFDPAEGITQVALDLDTEHYWMKIRRVTERE